MTRITHEVRGLGSQRPLQSKADKNCLKLHWQGKDVVSREGAPAEWLATAGGSLPWPLEHDGDDGKGQDDHSTGTSNHQTQGAAVHLHGLTSLPRVEEGVSRDAPGRTGHREVWQLPGPQGPPSNKHHPRCDSSNQHGAVTRAWPHSKCPMQTIELNPTGQQWKRQGLLQSILTVLI